MSYDHKTLEVLKGLDAKRHRPWQLLYVGDGAGTPKLDLAGLDHIFELMPEVSCLNVRLSSGEGFTVSRDFPSNYLADVDQVLRTVFERNPDIIGIEFPARGNTPAHVATPENPFWSAHGKDYENIGKAIASGEISPEEAIARIKALHKRQDVESVYPES